MDTISHLIVQEYDGSHRRVSCHWLYGIDYRLGSDASPQGTLEEEEYPIGACELMLISVALEALERWPSSWVLPSSGLPPSSGWVQHSPLPSVMLIPLPSPHQSLTWDQVTSQVGEQLERPVELVAPEVQLLLLTAQREIG